MWKPSSFTQMLRIALTAMTTYNLHKNIRCEKTTESTAVQGQ